MATLTPASRVLTRRVLREEIRERLVDDILRGRLQPGARLVETRLAQEFGVSQAPVREALRDLELLGFVVSSAFRGTQVRRISKEELAEMYPIRAALEGIAARAAATRIDEPALAHLEELLGTMRDAAARGDSHAQIETDTAFHYAIIEASCNRLVKQFWEAMRLATTTFVTMSMIHRSLRELADRHVPVLAALRARDPVMAEAAMRRHIEELGDWILATAEQTDAPNGGAECVQDGK